jgi:hypothetical protein
LYPDPQPFLDLDNKEVLEVFKKYFDSQYEAVLDITSGIIYNEIDERFLDLFFKNDIPFFPDPPKYIDRFQLYFYEY